jgi:DNA processing protein
VALRFLAKPGDPVLGAALRTRTASELLALVTGADTDGEALLADQPEDASLRHALPRLRDRLGEIPSTARLASWQDSGLRLVIPGDAEWPPQLDDPRMPHWPAPTVKVAAENMWRHRGDLAATILSPVA